MLTNFNLSVLESMKHSPIRNYVLPGLTSWLIGGKSEHGLVRLFECERDHQECVAPHNHRFGFQCFVLAGSVRNVIWTPCKRDEAGDLYWITTLYPIDGGLGNYRIVQDSLASSRWKHSARTYGPGDTYSMTASQLHSIWFSRGAKVLFFEGPQTEASSIYLEPDSGGERVSTVHNEPWMFKRNNE
jgi:hypothetical protein